MNYVSGRLEFSLIYESSQMNECCIYLHVKLAMHNDMRAEWEETIVRAVPCGHIF
jgi:hypothetical protein